MQEHYFFFFFFPFSSYEEIKDRGREERSEDRVCENSSLCNRDERTR